MVCCEQAGKKDGRWHIARGKSELRRVGCLVKARAAGRLVDSPDWHTGFGQGESNRDQIQLLAGVKRAILPAAISDTAAKDGHSPRLKVESSHEGDDVTAGAGTSERDDHHNRTRLTLFPPCSQRCPQCTTWCP